MLKRGTNPILQEDYKWMHLPLSVFHFQSVSD